MANKILSQEKPVAEPGLADLLALHKKDIMTSLNCHALAQVQDVNYDKQTLTAKINYQKTYFNRNTAGSSLPTLVDYPPLTDIPFIVIGGGSSHLTMPIKPGDNCLILFNDRDMDNWLNSGQISGVATPRYHSLADGLALVGLSSFQSPIADYDPDNPNLYNGTTGVKVKAETILIYNQLTTLNTLLQDLVNAIKEITTVGSDSISPASQATLAAVATQIAGLLE